MQQLHNDELLFNTKAYRIFGTCIFIAGMLSGLDAVFDLNLFLWQSATAARIMSACCTMVLGGLAFYSITDKKFWSTTTAQKSEMS